MIFLILVALLFITAAGAQNVNAPTAPPNCSAAIIKRIDWGAGSNSFGIEGAARVAGRSRSIWDVYQTRPAAIADGATADVAADFYNRYSSDITLMQQLGLKHFRFSISWSRLLPAAVKGSAVNPAAVKFYNAVLDDLAAAGIEPMVALYHWDLPQTLQDSYEGFISRNIIEDFVYFADTSFRLFGNRVRRWLTFIEPYVICNMQYGNGQFAPGKDYGDEGRYKCGYHVLLAHGSAVQLYRQKYQASQGAQLSFTTLVTWPEPATAAAGDKRAAQNKLDAEVGWFLDPAFFGDYPDSLKQTKGKYLPSFTPAERQLVRNSLDFIAANCFTAKFVTARPGSTTGWRESKYGSDGKLIGPASGIPWMNIVPWSQERFLRYLSDRYSPSGASAQRVPILISSLGTQVLGEEQQRIPQVLQDAFRVKFYHSYLDSICATVKSGQVNLLGVYAWSLFDGFEWTDGYRRKFGLIHVQYAGPQGTPAAVAAAGGGLKRSPKQSALWLSRYFWQPRRR